MKPSRTADTWELAKCRRTSASQSNRCSEVFVSIGVVRVRKLDGIIARGLLLGLTRSPRLNSESLSPDDDRRAKSGPAPRNAESPVDLSNLISAPRWKWKTVLWCRTVRAWITIGRLQCFPANAILCYAHVDKEFLGTIRATYYPIVCITRLTLITESRARGKC